MTIFNLEILKKLVLCPFFEMAPAVCADIFCINRMSKSLQPKRDFKKIVILSDLSSLLGDKIQLVTGSVDEIAALSYLDHIIITTHKYILFH